MVSNQTNEQITLSTQKLNIQKVPRTCLRTQLILETSITCITWWFGQTLLSTVRQDTYNSDNLNSHWPGKARSFVHYGAQGQVRGHSFEDEADTSTESILVLTLINAATRNLGIWAGGCCAVFNAFLVKVLSVLKTAGAHKVNLKPFLSKGKMLSLRISERW